MRKKGKRGPDTPQEFLEKFELEHGKISLSSSAAVVEKIANGNDLTAKEQRTFEVLNFIHSRLCKVVNKKQVIEEIKEGFGMSQSQAYTRVRDAEELFGQIMTIDKETVRTFVLQRAMEVAKKARKAKDIEVEVKALAIIGKYSNLDKEDENKHIPQMPDVILTSDSTVLTIQSGE